MKRATGVWIAVGAVAILALGGAATWALTRAPGADAAAQGFLDALAAGDGDGALALLDEAPESTQDALAAFEAADARIDEPHVGSVAESGGTAVAQISLTLAGSVWSGSLDLVREASGWTVSADALGELTATTAIGDTVRIGDLVIDASAPVALLPAEYTVAAAPAEVLEGDTRVAVLPGDAATADVDAHLAAGATDAAQRQLDAYADACAAAADAVPAHCGIRVPWGADLLSLDRIAFRIDRYPSLQLSDDARTFTAGDGVLVVTAAGTPRDGGAPTVTYRTRAWTMRGDVSFEGGRMVLSVR